MYVIDQPAPVAPVADEATPPTHEPLPVPEVAEASDEDVDSFFGDLH